MSSPTGASQEPKHRRSFFTAVVAIVAGGLALLAPLAAGVVAFLSPLARKRKSVEVPVALLEQIPADGRPHFLPVVASRVDAWNRYPQDRVGSVYLIRNAGDEKPLALSSKCPHAGCAVNYTPGDENFNCPCHTSQFAFDGSRVHGDAEVSPRAMDSLPVSLKPVEGTNATEVWVEFIDYQTGTSEKIPTA